MKSSVLDPVRIAGLAAIAAGLIFAAIQPVHPADVVASVTTRSWAVITTAKLAMCLLFLFGIGGLYAKQSRMAGVLGLVGFLLLTVSWGVQTGYVFTETLVLPPLAAVAPGFVDDFLGIARGDPAASGLGALPAVYNLLVGIPYMLGGLVFGIATVRARVFPRLPAILLAVAAVVTPAAALLPHHIQRYAAVPMGLAIAWLGYTLWTARPAAAVQPAHDANPVRLGTAHGD